VGVGAGAAVGAFVSAAISAGVSDSVCTAVVGGGVRVRVSRLPSTVAKVLVLAVF
jgi:hypothetical protein